MKQRSLEDFFNLSGRAVNPPVRNSEPVPRRDIPQPSVLRLPHHTKNLWRFLQPKLLQLSTGKSDKIEDFLEILCDFAVETRLQTRNNNDDARFMKIVQKIAEFALEVEVLFNTVYYIQPIQILTKHSDYELKLSQRQIRCLLSLMFLCALPKQEKYLDLPGDYTFIRLYAGSQDRDDQSIQKLRCFINYFERAEDAEDDIYLSFIRRELHEKIEWTELDKPFTDITIEEKLLPSEDFPDKLIIDFAASHIGGGVLGKGCVQEEIMMLRYIEPIVSLLFTEKLEDRECLVIIGAQRFNQLQGYKNTFEYIDNYYEALNLDCQGRNDTHIVAIDAINFYGKSHIQYFPGFIQRELNKALIGFLGDPNENSFREIVTGRWGCGAFQGDDQLKFVIQCAAAAVSNRSMMFLTWDMKSIPTLHAITHLLKNLKVKDVVNALNKYKNNNRDDVFTYLLKVLNSVNY